MSQVGQKVESLQVTAWGVWEVWAIESVRCLERTFSNGWNQQREPTSWTATVSGDRQAQRRAVQIQREQERNFNKLAGCNTHHLCHHPHNLLEERSVKEIYHQAMKFYLQVQTDQLFQFLLHALLFRILQHKPLVFPAMKTQQMSILFWHAMRRML